MIAVMVELLKRNLGEIATLCRRYGIRKLELFGSAARDDFDPARSDVDFFFEFDDDASSLSDRFFGLMEDLERVLGCKVDLVSSQDVRNPYFLKVANQHRITLYAALSRFGTRRAECLGESKTIVPGTLKRDEHVQKFYDFRFGGHQSFAR